MKQHESGGGGKLLKGLPVVLMRRRIKISAAVTAGRVCVCRLSSLSLTPEETPEMSFHADTRSLRQAITSFGSVTAQVIHTHTEAGAVFEVEGDKGVHFHSCPVPMRWSQAAHRERTDSSEKWNFMV